MSEESDHLPAQPSTGRLALIVVLMWLSLVLGPLALCAPFVCLYLGVLVVKQRSYRALAALVCTPLVILMIFGASAWFSKKPAYLFTGYPRPEAFNLKADSRCYALSGGCIVDGSEVIIHSSYNVGLWIMCALFGWPPHTYHGRFPNENEAINLTERALSTSLEDFEKGIIRLQGQTIAIQAEVAERMMDAAQIWPGLDEPEKIPLIRAALAGDDCLIIRVSNQGGEQSSDHVYLFDTKRLKAFARYQIGHRTSTRPFFAAYDVE